MSKVSDYRLRRAWHTSSSFQMENTPRSLFGPRYWLVNSIICGVCLALLCARACVRARVFWVWSTEGRSGGHLSALLPFTLKVEGSQGRSEVNRFQPPWGLRSRRREERSIDRPGTTVLLIKRRTIPSSVLCDFRDRKDETAVKKKKGGIVCYLGGGKKMLH